MAGFQCPMLAELYIEALLVDEELAEVRSVVADAHRIVFLGFTYHNQNVDLLTPEGEKNARKVYGSAYGMSAPDTEHAELTVRKNLLKFASYRCTLRNNLAARQLLDEYSRELSQI